MKLYKNVITYIKFTLLKFILFKDYSEDFIPDSLYLVLNFNLFLEIHSKTMKIENKIHNF